MCPAHPRPGSRDWIEVASTGSYQSVERAFDLLEMIAESGPVRVSELAEAADMGQSTVSRVLSTLESLGAARRNPRTGLFELGPLLITFGGSALNQDPVHGASRQIAHGLSTDWGLGANVAIRDGKTVFYLANFDGRLSPKSQTLVGQRKPLHATALGLALISEMSEEELRDLFDESDFHPMTPRTISSFSDLLERLAEVRGRGWATENGELTLGRGCVAAPIRDSTGEISAALSMSGPQSAIRISEREEELAGAVIEAAEAISTNLGYVANYQSSLAAGSDRPA